MPHSIQTSAGVIAFIFAGSTALGAAVFMRALIMFGLQPTFPEAYRLVHETYVLHPALAIGFAVAGVLGVVLIGPIARLLGPGSHAIQIGSVYGYIGMVLYTLTALLQLDYAGIAYNLPVGVDAVSDAAVQAFAVLYLLKFLLETATALFLSAWMVTVCVLGLRRSRLPRRLAYGGIAGGVAMIPLSLIGAATPASPIFAAWLAAIGVRLIRESPED